MKRRQYYWFKTNGIVEEISEPGFYFLLERKKHTLVQVAGGTVVLNQGADSILIKKKQLEQILKIQHTVKFKKGQPASWDELDTLILKLPVKSKKEKEHPISIFDRDCEILVRYEKAGKRKGYPKST